MLYHATGSPTTDLTDAEIRAALNEVLARLEPRKRVIAVPPDYTRGNSYAGPITCMAYDYFGDRLTDVMPALGTHVAMPDWQLEKMFPIIPKNLIRVHRWRDDVVQAGELPAKVVSQLTEGIWQKPWPAQLNQLILEGGHDLILSIGQVVPHEVIGMANYNKNLLVGTGGPRGISESHFIGAAYGMERIMGKADNPVRRIMNRAWDEFCSHLPVLWVQTVIGPREDGSLAVRGLFIGDDVECFMAASELALAVNFEVLEEEPAKIVVYLDPDEFHSTWLGNKSIYRTRMAIATGGELVVLAPAVGTFGEDPEIDRLIRRYGYRTTPQVMEFVEQNQDLRDNLSAAAHLIHGSSEGRFTITYCPGKLSQQEIESVGYQYGDLEEMSARYDRSKLTHGFNDLSSGERIYFIDNPALGLWAHKSRLQ